MKRKEKHFWNPYKIFESLAMRGFFKNMNDKENLSQLYRARMGKFPDLDHPKSFNEKLQWLKLNDRKPEYTEMVDKYLLKNMQKNIQVKSTLSLRVVFGMTLTKLSLNNYLINLF